MASVADVGNLSSEIVDLDLSDSISDKSLFGDMDFEDRSNPIEIGSMEPNVLITGCEDDFSYFYIQRFCEKSCIEQFASSIHIIAQTQKEPKEFLEGVTYLACFTNDNSWYRAKLLSLHGTKVKVKFIDYGNVEFLSKRRIRKCPEYFWSKYVSPFTYRCKLWNIEPESEWHKNGALFFLEMQNNSKLTNVYFHSVEECDNGDYSKIYEVDVQVFSSPPGVSDNQIFSIRDAFLYLELGKPKQNLPVPNMWKADKNIFGPRTYTALYIPTNKQSAKAFALEIKSPTHFYLQLETSYELWKGTVSKMKQLYDSLSNESHGNWKIFLPDVGMLCAVKDEQSGNWHRTLIKELQQNAHVLIHYVDLGKECVVHISRLRKIADKMLVIPAQAIRCSLSNIVSPSGDEEWPSEVTNCFKEILKNNSKNIYVNFHRKIDDCYEVNINIRTAQGNYDLSKTLLDDNMASPNQELLALGEMTADMSKHIKLHFSEDNFNTSTRTGLQKANPKRKCVQIIEKSQSPPTASDKVGIVKSQYHVVKILKVETPNLIFCRFLSLEEKFNQVNDLLLKKFKSSPKNKTIREENLIVGKLYVVNFKATKPYIARAKILQVDEDSCKVILVDCGGLCTVPNSDLYPLPRDLMDTSPLSLVVSLSAIDPPCGQSTWPKTSVECLKSHIEKCNEIYMLKSGARYRDGNFWNQKILPVEMGYIEEVALGPFEPSREEFISFRSILLNDGLALPLRQVSPKEVGKLNSNLSSQNASCEPSLAASEGSITSDFAHFVAQQYNKFELNHSEVDDFVAISKSESAVDSIVSNKSEEKNLAKSNNTNKCIEYLRNGGSHSQDENFPSSASTSPPLRDIVQLPDQPILEDNFECVVTNILHDGVICLHPSYLELSLEQMVTIHKMRFDNTELTDLDLCWHVGDYVAAKFHIDNCWYRAKILDKCKNGKVKVEFIDYGNIELTPIDKIRNANLFPDRPPMCYKCVLHKLKPVDKKGWTDDKLDILHRLTVMQRFKVCVVKQEKNCLPEVILNPMREDLSTLMSVLCDKLHICQRIPTQEPIPEEEVVEYEKVTPDLRMLLEKEESDTFTPPCMALPYGTPLLCNVKITRLVNYHSCFLEFLDKISEDLDDHVIFRQILGAQRQRIQLFREIKEDLSKYKLKLPPKNGCYYIFYDESQDKIVRVRLISIDEEKGAILVNVENGESFMSSENFLYFVPYRFREIPFLCIPASLRGIKPPGAEYPEETFDALEECLVHTKQNICAKFVSQNEEEGDLPKVDLYYRDSQTKNVLCYASLQEAGLIDIED